ncbi:MAG: glutamate racemase, partial [Candidatus Ornithomonoglobus sp.]
YEAVRATKNKKIGIIGTSATIHSGAYTKYIKEYDSRMQTFERACPLFVPLVENGHFNTKVTDLLIEEYLSDIRDAGVDTLILGCTHYPLLAGAISRFMGSDVTLISPGEEVAKFLRKKLTDELRHGDMPDKDQYKFFVSDSIEQFEELGSIFLEQKIDGQVSKIDIEKY